MTNRLHLTGKVYQQPNTGKPYTVIVVDGQEIVVMLERGNKALPVNI